MTPHLHVVPVGDPLREHRLAECPCRPRLRDIPRVDGTVETIHLHRALVDIDEPRHERPIPAAAAHAA